MKRMHTDREIRSMADESAKIRIEAGQTENAKPIYCHPISLVSKADFTKVYRLTALIFNNSATPFTLATFKAFLDDLYSELGETCRILMSGCYKRADSSIIIASYLSVTENDYALIGLTSSGNINSETNSDFYELFPEAYTNFYDGVNKIN